jgi:steroid delta-isomerase-like uncharacterized protein
MSDEAASDVAQRMLAAWNSRNLDALVELLADDVEWYDPAMAKPPARGRAAVRAFADAVLHAFPDFRYEIQAPICVAADGSRCTILWRISATHLSPLAPLGYAPTGRQASFEGVDVIDVRDGKVTRILTAFDPLVPAEQLTGIRLRPVPGTWRARIVVAVQRMVASWARKTRPEE